MTAQFHYYYEDALAAAEQFANENNGYIARDSRTMDDTCKYDYQDIKANNLCWSGEVAAIVVRHNDTHDDIAYCAWWCSKEEEEANNE